MDSEQGTQVLNMGTNNNTLLKYQLVFSCVVLACCLVPRGREVLSAGGEQVVHISRKLTGLLTYDTRSPSTQQNVRGVQPIHDHDVLELFV